MGDARGRVPALDGVRGVAILLVLVDHSGVPITHWPFGVAGVQVFFLLSGYLITGLLLAERERCGRIDLLAFGLRRAARLMPALALMCAGVLLLAGWRMLDPALTAMTYRRPAALPFLHTWSLAVEVHFYLLWAVALAVLPRRWVAPVAMAAAAASLGLRAGAAVLTFDTPSNLWGPLIGSALAASGVRVPEWRALAWRPLVALGTVSYGVYLWHYPLLNSYPMSGPQRAATILLAVALGAASWRWVERPAIQWARQVRRAPATNAPRPRPAWSSRSWR